MAGGTLTSFNEEKLIECFTKQLSELELFETMYTPKEIIITNTDVVDGIRDFVAKKTLFAPNHLDYTIIQDVEKLKLEMSIHLPSLYPDTVPELHVRCNQLNRHQEKSLNDDLSVYVQSKHDGEVCIFTAILWLQDNAEQYVKTPTTDLPAATPVKAEKNFSRYWIYSHHIYCKKKTEEITKLAKELNLTGFCLLGKPGMMCGEGYEEDCKEWWKHIKTLHWQKISLRITEIFNSNEMAKQKKFQSFNVISFPGTIANLHTDLGSFQQYLQKYGLQEQMAQFFASHSMSMHSLN